MSVHSRIQIPWFRGLLLAAVSACSLAPEIGELQLELSSGYKAQVRKGTLFVTGSAASSRLALRLGPTGLLEVDVGDDGSADFQFDRSTFDRIVVDAGAGDDVVRMDESNGAFTNEELITIIGGDGNDTLIGGVGAETFYGGRGDDTIDGGPGIDIVFMGEGDDSFVWRPGGNSDVIEGEGGIDTLVFNGSAASEGIDLSADGDRLRFVRDVAAVTLDAGGIERVDLRVLGGTDSVVVHDLAGTSVARVDVDLGATGDGQADVVTVDGAPGAGTIDVMAEGAAVVATGLAAEVSVTNGEPALDRLLVNGGGGVVNVNGSAGADTMTVFADGGAVAVQVAGFGVIVDAQGMGKLAVNGLGGDDTIRALSSVTIPLQLDGGDGNDVVTGGSGPDTIIGGPGDDLLDGGLGSDTVRMGSGDDVFVWNPGGSSDVVDGEDGTDTLVFNGSAASEGIDLGANGDRLRLVRDVAAVTLDAGGIERVDLRALGGTDSVVVHDLTGTAVAQVSVDVGDAQFDTVTVNGSPAADAIAISADAGAVVVSGLAAAVRITHPDVSDQLVVNGLGGVDTFTAGPGVDLLLALIINQD